MNPSRARRAADLVIPLQEPNPLPPARSVPKACTASLDAHPVAAASARGATHLRMAVLIDAIGEVLAGHADHASLPSLQASIVDKISNR